MANKNLFLILSILFLAMIVPFSSAVCTTTPGYTNGTDFMGVVTSADKTITMTDTEMWTGFSFFTPRLNFTKVVTDFVVGQDVNGINTLGWKTTLDVSSTFAVYNDSVLVDPSNYTLLQTPVTGLKRINWTDNRYQGQDLVVNFTRTFVKNVDDIVVSPASIYTATSAANWLSTNTPATYGDDKTFRFNAASLGASVNNTNWAVGWENSNTVCVADTACQSPVNMLLFNILAAMFMIGMIVFAAYYFATGGEVTPQHVLYFVVAFIIMCVALAIINQLVQAVCTVPGL